MKGELEGSFHVALEGAPKIFFQGTLKITQKGEEKDTFDVVMDCMLDSAFEIALEGAPKDVLKNLCKDSQEATITFESKQNVVNILNFQLFFIMFNLSTMQAISRGSVG